MIKLNIDTNKLVAEARQDSRLAMLPPGVLRTMFVSGNLVFLWVQLDSHGIRNQPLERAAEQVHALCHTLLADYGLNNDEQDYAFRVVDKLLAREIEKADKTGKLQDIKGKLLHAFPTEEN